MNASPSLKLPAIALAGALALLPLLQCLPVDVDKVAPLLFLPAVAFVVFSRYQARSTSGERMDGILLGGAGIIILIGCLHSTHSARSLVALASLAWIVADAWSARQLMRDSTTRPWLWAGICVGATIGLILVRWKISPDIQTFPWYQHPRLFGLHMFAGALASLAWLVTEPPRQRGLRILAWSLAILCWIGLLWSGSRAPIVGLFIGLLTWYSATRADDRSRLRNIVPMLVLAGALGSLCLGTPGHHLGWQRALERSAAASDMDSLSSNRLDIWIIVSRAILQHPLLGQGLDSYDFLQPTLNGNQPHNVLLQWTLDSGCITAILFVSVFTRRIWRGLFAQHRSSSHVAAAALSVSCVVCALFDGVYYHAMILLPAAVFLALSGFETTVSANPPRAQPSQRWFICLGLSCATAVLLLHSWLQWRLVGTPPPSPTSQVARVLRSFPSTTAGLPRWLQFWQASMPDVALDWAHWAQQSSSTPAIYHDIAARIYIGQDNLSAAAAEYQAAIIKAYAPTVPYFESMLRLTEAAIREQHFESPPR